MSAIGWLDARSGKNAVEIFGSSSSTKVAIIGASCLYLRGGEVDSFTIALPPDKSSVVLAVRLLVDHNDKKKSSDYYGVFVGISKKDGKVWADLKRPFLSPDGRIAQIMEVSGRFGPIIMALVGEKKLTTSPEPKPGEARVGADAICQWLNGDIDDEQLLAEVEEVEAELSAREQLPALLKQVNDLTASVEFWRKAYEEKNGESMDAWAQHRTAYKMLERRQQFCQEQAEIIKQLRLVIERLAKSVGRVFWLKKAIRNDVAFLQARINEIADLEKRFLNPSFDGKVEQVD